MQTVFIFSFFQKRVGKMKREYHAVRIENTTFTVVVSLPLHDPSTDKTYRIHATNDIRREVSFKKGIVIFLIF